jgi:ABC-type transport system substrate-binding protein
MSGNEYDIALFNPVAPGSLPCDIFANYPVFVPQGWTGPVRDEYLALGAKANATADLAARQDVVFDLLKMFNEQILWYGLCEDPIECAYNKDLQSIDISNTGVWILQNMHF